MFNNIVKLEKLYEFLWLYKRSFDKDFIENEKLLELSREITKIGDEEYNNSSKIVKRIIDIVHLYEFDKILNSNNKDVDYFEEFWMLRISQKVSQIKNPTNNHQKYLIKKAKEFVNNNSR